MSLDFKLPMPAATGSTPAAAAKGAARKSLADAGQFDALLAGGKLGVDAKAAARDEATRPETDWKSRKNIWATRELKAARQPDDADAVAPAKDEAEQEPEDIVAALATIPPTPVEVAAPDAPEAGAEQSLAAGTPAPEQLRGRREAGGKDDAKAASRSPAATVIAALQGGQTPSEAQQGDMSAGLPEAAVPAEASPDAAGEKAGGTAEKPVDKGVLNRESAPRDRADPKITFVSSQVSIAPAPTTAPALSSTGTAFVASLASDGALPQYVSDVANAAPVQDARPVTTLKIQLHPAELGTVTVQLSGSGEQLAVEVQVETHEARHRLASDSDAIVKALRGMGYDIDRITVQQAPSTASTPGGGSNRENAFTPQEGRSGERQEQSARQGSDQRHEQNARTAPVPSGERGQPGGSGVYI